MTNNEHGMLAHIDDLAVALVQAEQALVYIADRVQDEHLEDVANKAIDAIAKVKAGSHA